MTYRILRYALLGIITAAVCTPAASILYVAWHLYRAAN